MDTIKDRERELRAVFDGCYGWPIRDLLLCTNVGDHDLVAP
jgi:hypothetical protein